MTSVIGQDNNLVVHQQLDYMSEENPRVYTVMNSVPLCSSNEISQEQQIVYINTPVNYQPINNQQSYVYQQQLPRSQMVQQYVSTNLTAQHNQQQVSSFINMPPPVAHQSIPHSNMNQQQALIPSYQPNVYEIAQPYSSMTNPTVSSTPISASTKRGRNDTSGVSESNVPLRPHYPQSTRIFNSGNTPNKRSRGVNQQHNEAAYSQSYQNVQGTSVTMDLNANQQQPSAAACRFAISRFPFSPFSVIFTQDVREKVVVDDLIKHARENRNFELKTVAYRRGRTETNECRILIFVENTESFAFLYDQSNWPATLAGFEFSLKSPSIPPQLALVLPTVSLQVEWDDFVQELKDKYPGVVNIIRLKNKAQQPVRAVKLECSSSVVRNEMLEVGEVGIMHMKYKVVEYYAQANVLICSNCYGIGHFRKNCPQKQEVTCRTCGDKCANLKEHQCSGILKCIHCGGDHVSNDSKCKVVKDYRAALTRNLLSKVIPANMDDPRSRPVSTNMPISSAKIGYLPYLAAAQMMPVNVNDVLLKKLDSIVAKVEEESNATRLSLGEVREEMKNRYEETKQHVNMLENKVITLEKKFEDLTLQMYTLVQNICTALSDPQGAQNDKWKIYWQEQIKTLVECRSTHAKSSS